MLHIITATTIISLLSLAGVAFLSTKHIPIKALLALAAGTMLGNTFFHLLPEAAEMFTTTIWIHWTLYSFIGFYVLERIIHYHHCHDKDCEIKQSLAVINIIGDAVHNFTDGILIAAAFLINPTIGITTTIAIALHELPLEIGDYAIFRHAGYSKTKALLLNLLSGVSAIAGGIIGYLFLAQSEALSIYALPIAAGSFLYIAMSDLIPELNSSTKPRKQLSQFLIFILAIGLMYFIQIYTHEAHHASHDHESHTEEHQDHHDSHHHHDH